jgi:putative tryptophan/tyrosine transport system ATP-binding protein
MLCLENVTQVFLGNPDPVLKQVSFNLKEGEFCIVVGSNGSGKSTLSKIILGEISPTKGKVYLKGNDVTDMPVHKRARFMSRVSQDISQGTLHPLTLLENLVLSKLRAYPSTYSFYKRDIREWEKCVGEFDSDLLKYMHTPLCLLSGGQRQSVALLMATLIKPDLLILDEHTSALDPKTSENLMSYTHSVVSKHKITTLMITHNLKQALQYGDRILMLNKGQVILNICGEDKTNLSTEILLKQFYKDF